MKMNLLVAFIATVSVSAKDHGLRGGGQRELNAASVYDYDYNGYGTGGVAPNRVVILGDNNGYGTGGVAPNLFPGIAGYGGVNPAYTGLAGYNNGYNTGGIRGGVGPNFVPADLPRRVIVFGNGDGNGYGNVGPYA
eukprot:CAMPEP_0170934234 /NCGR_PEP_ID=MMETSP0735-20130129/18200_1 /TAXON_ID=186038 /ORGANISM="Fragilariopsis kerguelensis, Strain L26-C5" /LENGTH=135 /DNA_ID=CAMNT_0011337351 /DNA_START=101 /DNA_END=505 /DNA_ORIENTATION=-